MCTLAIFVFSFITTVSAPGYLPALPMQNSSPVPNFGAIANSSIHNDQRSIFSTNQVSVPTAQVNGEDNNLESSSNVVEEFLNQIANKDQMKLTISMPVPATDEEYAIYSNSVVFNEIFDSIPKDETVRRVKRDVTKPSPSAPAQQLANIMQQSLQNKHNKNKATNANNGTSQPSNTTGQSKQPSAPPALPQSSKSFTASKFTEISVKFSPKYIPATNCV
ncbi:hypothetical protein DdX_22486 [Ditylenchus destructor]|uniref:Uncharacterized protein n=1 Tax=Ditylenchus destructor TaxID=166010 RepID=A0AAD4MEA9_9BILA|nr:hypothetical protein DdX_22486 [Ditylenchus destructor]